MGLLVCAVGAAAKAAGYVNKRYTETAYGLPFGVGTFHQNRPLFFLRLFAQRLHPQLGALFEIGYINTQHVAQSFSGQACVYSNLSFDIARAHVGRSYSRSLICKKN